MTPQQALETLDNAVSQLSLSRKDHITLVQAVGVLKEAISPKESKPKARNLVKSDEQGPQEGN